MTRLLTIMGSGETSPTMVKPHREVFEQLSASSSVAGAPILSVFLDTPVVHVLHPFQMLLIQTQIFLAGILHHHAYTIL